MQVIYIPILSSDFSNLTVFNCGHNLHTRDLYYIPSDKVSLVSGKHIKDEPFVCIRHLDMLIIKCIFLFCFVCLSFFRNNTYGKTFNMFCTYVVNFSHFPPDMKHIG